MELRLRPETLAVHRLAPDAPWPVSPGDGTLFSVTSTGDELSVVCRDDLVVHGRVVERGWRALTVAGPIAFSTIGVLAALATPLADAAIGIFVLSTFDTDHLLVSAHALGPAVAALRAGGHSVFGDTPA